MDAITNLMDNFVIHVSPLQRALPTRIPVGTIGHLAAKRNWICHPFSLILSGGGTYSFRGKKWKIDAPCVITQWPDEYVEYGPSGQWHHWKELFLIYDRKHLSEFVKAGLANSHTPTWKIHDLYGIRRQLAQLSDLLLHRTSSGNPDRIDRLCESLLVETHLTCSRSSETPHENAVRAVQALVQSEFLKRNDFDFDALAAKQGLSPSTFRRHWARLETTPPTHYVMQLRIREARRRLVETRMCVGDIAAAVGFEDPLYFSRKFKQTTGLTATEYRLRYQPTQESSP